VSSPQNAQEWVTALHEKTASSPGQSLGGGDDKSGLVVSTESGVRGVAKSGDIGGSVDPPDSTVHCPVPLPLSSTFPFALATSL